MSFKKDAEQDRKDNTSATAEYMKKINESFISALEDEKKKKQHEKYMDAVLSAWLALMFANFEEDLYKSAQFGIDVADKQLKAKNITTKVDKSINAEQFKLQVQSRLESVKSDLVTVAEEVKSNNANVFRDLGNAIDKKKREELSAELLGILKENGITHFYDRAGRAWQIENYVKMRTLTETMQAQRLAFFTRAMQYGIDLVRVKHLNIHPTCELCAPFEGKILSINGNTPGYMTVEEARMQGLFHPNCDHITEELELAPEDAGGEGEIDLTEANKKRSEYNKKRDYKAF